MNAARKVNGLFGIAWVFLFFIILSASNATAQQNPLKFSYLTVDDGLSHTDVKEIKQDKLGFIWIATLYGLDRYDGHEIKRFYNTTVPKNFSFKNRIRSMCLDESDRIWLGTEDGIQFFDPRLEQYSNVDNPEHNTGKKTYSRLIALKSTLLATIAETKLRLFRINGKTLEDIPLKCPPGVGFSDMIQDNHGNLWLSSNNGLWILDHAFHFRRFEIAAESGKGLSNLLKVFLNRQSQLIVVVGTSAILSNETTGKLLTSKSSLTNPQKQLLIPGCSIINDIIQDKKLDYWVSTDVGLFLLDKNFTIKETITTQSFVSSLNTNFLDKIFIDRSECLWVCTFGGGVDFCDLNEKLFYTFQHNPEIPNTLSGNHIRSILEQSGHIVWIGTNSNGLNQYDFNTKIFKHYNTSSNGIRLKSNEVNALVLDNDQNLWIASDKGLEIINRQRTGLFHPPGFEKFPAGAISSLVKDCYGNIWFGSYYYGYGNIIHNKNNSYTLRNRGSGSSYFMWADEHRPVILISSINGLKRLIIDTAGNVVKSFQYRVNNQSNSLSSNYVFPIRKQTDSTYWIGTIGGGLDFLTLKKDNTYGVKIYDGKYGVFNDVESLEIDDKGDVWMGGNGLERLDLQTKKLTRFDKNDGLQGNSFKVGASYKGKNGRLYFGGINGLNYFFPDSIKSNNITAHPVFTDLVINNKSTHIDGSSPAENTLPKSIPYSNRITLNYLQNNFVVSFSSMHYANPSKCKFRYKLNGFDSEWNYTTGKNPTAAYTNLDYNKYILILEASNNDGIWSPETATLNIEVTPPWWKSFLAKTIYTMLFIAVLLGIYIYQARWFRLKRELAIRDIEEKKREEMHLQREELYRQQLQFFANISHEFRTPLSLILGPLENLMVESAATVYQHTFRVMYRNAKRLINLIHELINFRKVADNAIKLHVVEVNTQNFVTELFDEFKDLADKNKIEFTLKLPETSILSCLDNQVAEKILLNLLNNAFKYTSTGGKVTLEVFTDFNRHQPIYLSEYKLLNDFRAGNYTFFSVADTGIGISQESIGQIFDRYYRISNDHIGSGIGLALVKSLTVLHKGDIYVYSERHKGTEIIIALPREKQDYSITEQAGSAQNQPVVMLEQLDNSAEYISPDHGYSSEKSIADPNQSQHILLVEDNDELRSFLKAVLQKRYVVYEALNGQEGYEIAVEHNPDLIISDVMMPVMNGIELCSKIKNAFETSHIPFLLLSAKSALEARLEGLESGADYYIAKPVSIDLLLLTIHNLFEQKRKLKLKYAEDYYTEATELVHSTQDKDFLNKLIKLIEANMHDPDLDVDFICDHMYTSRSKLYKKIKSISDQSINEFIRTIRLKKAAYIMTHEDVTQIEIAERIGIKSLSYFQKAFRKEFGKTPSQFTQIEKG